MAGRELRRLGRRDLVEIIYQLKTSENELQQEISELRKQLDERTLKIKDVGSIAEASIALSNVFAEAQSAADIYLEQIRKRREETEVECEEILTKARQQAEELLEDAKRQREDLLRPVCEMKNNGKKKPKSV